MSEHPYDTHARSGLRPRSSPTTTDPDLMAVVCFCLIGLLICLNLMLRFPEFGAIIQLYNQF
jgi:hypothetical protein